MPARTSGERQEARAVESPPPGLGHLQELVGHQETLRARASTLRHALAQTDRREWRLDRVAVRRCFQCSAGKSKNVSSTSASVSRVLTAFGYLGPYSAANRVTASQACSRVSAYITSWSAAFTRGCSRFGSLSRMLPSL